MQNKILDDYEKAYAKGYAKALADASLYEPWPCDGSLFKEWRVTDYLRKVVEEFTEATDAVCGALELEGQPVSNSEKIAAWEHAMQECVDVITATTSLMEICGCDIAERKYLQLQVNLSNSLRDNGQRIQNPPLSAEVAAELLNQIRRRNV